MTRFDEQKRKHEQFQKEGIQRLQEKGYEVADGTYHARFSDIFRTRVMNLTYDPTALYIKGWADNYAIKGNFVALIEWKTQEYKREPFAGKRIPNGSIEATQYAIHYWLAQIGVRVLYVYRDEFYDVEKGFFIERGKPFSVVNGLVRFPVVGGGTTLEKQGEFLYTIFGDELKVSPKLSGNNVSSDPFFLIFADTLEKLPYWMDLLP